MIKIDINNINEFDNSFIIRGKKLKSINKDRQKEKINKKFNKQFEY